MSTASQYYDSLSDDDSQDNNFSDYTTKTKSSRKRAATIKKKISRVKVPKTKRPGRKPIEKAMEEELKGDPKSKRKAQNRAAQRAFRERKEKFVEELQKRIQELEEEKNSRVTDLEVENAALKKELQKLREKTNRPTTTFTTDYTLNNNNQQQSTPLSLNDEDEEIIEDDVPHGYKCNIDSIQSLNSPPLSTGATTLSHHDDDDDLSIASFSDHLLSDYSENDNLSEISIDNNSPASEHEIPPFDTFETNPIIQDENTMNENNNINSSNNNNNNNDLFTSSIINNGYYDSLISVPNNNNNNNELTNQNQESFSSANNNTNDLFHGKTDFTFTNYRNPVSSDDWLYQNENAIPPLFGLDADRYGLSQSQLNTETPYDEQPFYNTHNIYTTTNNNNININNNSNNIHSHNHNHNHNHNNSSMFLNNINHPSINNNSNSNNKNSHDCNNDKGYYRDPDLTPCKAKLLEAIHQAKKEGKTCGEVKQVVEKVCPDYNIDSLCDELRKKAVCFDNQSTFDDKDFEILKTCIKKH